MGKRSKTPEEQDSAFETWRMSSLETFSQVVDGWCSDQQLVENVYKIFRPNKKNNESKTIKVSGRGDSTKFITPAMDDDLLSMLTAKNSTFFPRKPPRSKDNTPIDEVLNRLRNDFSFQEKELELTPKYSLDDTPSYFVPNSEDSFARFIKSITSLDEEKDEKPNAKLVPVTILLPHSNNLRREGPLLQTSKWRHLEVKFPNKKESDRFDIIESLAIRMFFILHLLGVQKGKKFSETVSAARASFALSTQSLMTLVLNTASQELNGATISSLKKYRVSEPSLSGAAPTSAPNNRNFPQCEFFQWEPEPPVRQGHTRNEAREAYLLDYQVSRAISEIYGLPQPSKRKSKDKRPRKAKFQKFSHVAFESPCSTDTKVHRRSAGAVVHTLSFLLTVTSGTAVTLYLPAHTGIVTAPQFVLPANFKKPFNTMKKIKTYIERLKSHEKGAEKFYNAFVKPYTEKKYPDTDGKARRNIPKEFISAALVAQFFLDKDRFKGDITGLKWYQDAFEYLIPYYVPESLIPSSADTSESEPTDLKSV